MAPHAVMTSAGTKLGTSCWSVSERRPVLCKYSCFIKENHVCCDFVHVSYACKLTLHILIKGMCNEAPPSQLDCFQPQNYNSAPVSIASVPCFWLIVQLLLALPFLAPPTLTIFCAVIHFDPSIILFLVFFLFFLSSSVPLD